MDTKKHPKANLENYSRIFAQLALVLSLTIVYVLIQNKTFANDLLVLSDSTLNIDESTESNIIYEIEPPKRQPIKKKVIIDVVKQVDNQEEIIETIFENIDPDEPINIDDIVEETIEEPVIEEVPFIMLEDAPAFPGCKGTKEEMKECFTLKVRNFVGKKFNSELAESLNLAPGVQRISVLFKIDNSGNIVDVQARAPHKRLQEEAIRVIKLLPRMEPGKQRGNAVTVKYALPIAFKIE